MMFHCCLAAGQVPGCWSGFPVRRPQPYHPVTWSERQDGMDCGTLLERDLTVYSAAGFLSYAMSWKKVPGYCMCLERSCGCCGGANVTGFPRWLSGALKLHGHPGAQSPHTKKKHFHHFMTKVKQILKPKILQL